MCQSLRQIVSGFSNSLAIPAPALEQYISVFFFPEDHFTDVLSGTTEWVPAPYVQILSNVGIGRTYTGTNTTYAAFETFRIPHHIFFRLKDLFRKRNRFKRKLHSVAR